MHLQPEEMIDEAYRRYQVGDVATAERLCRQLLQRAPHVAEAVYLQGVIAQDADKMQQARELFHRATELAPDNPVFVNALGEIDLRFGRQTEALTSFRRATTLRPTYERAHNNLGRVQYARGDLGMARASFEEAVRLNPRYATAHNNLGAVLQAQGQLDAATACFRRAVAEKPDYPEAHFNLGTILQAMGDQAGAAGQFQKAVELRPAYARAHFLRGQALESLRHDYAALAAYHEAARLQPNDAEMQHRLGDFLMFKGDWALALAALERAIAIQPDRPDSFARLFYGRQLVCDWRNYEASLDRLWADAATALAGGQPTAVTPFQALTLPWSLERQLAIARSHCDTMVRHQRERGMAWKLSRSPRTTAARLRIGYLSGDFYDHPISHLLHGMFARHDRSRFEVFVYGFGKVDQSVYRQRIISECEHFVDVSSLSLTAVAQRIADDGVDILVDLMGHTGINRLGALALRPATIQVSYLGTLGTIGGDFIDYMITDRTVTPPEFAPHFVEKFVILPHSYLIAEPEPALPTQLTNRARYGLPDGGFVYCTFNSPYKIEPRLFAVWMRILAQVPGSVLWLYSTGPVMEDNLRREAEARCVAPERLVFAPWLPRPEHMLRHRAADLFLDTLLYNAAATASLSLQMGLPVLTCLGETFGSRVGASLLNTVGLPELITTDLYEYERLAIRLAQHPDELHQLRKKLVPQRLAASPLFDTPRFVRNLERAYQAMWEIHASGREPEPILVRE